MYAIIELGGRQNNVEKGSRIRCEKLDQAANETLTIDKFMFFRKKHGNVPCNLP